MSCCPKQIKVNDDLSADDIEFNLASCEQSCERYYGCDTVAAMDDRLKVLKGEYLECPVCGYINDHCYFPDLFVAETSPKMQEQEKLLVEMQEAGYNIVTCGECGNVFIYRTKGE